MQVTVTYRDTGQQGLLLPGSINKADTSRHGWPASLTGRRVANGNKFIGRLAQLKSCPGARQHLKLQTASEGYYGREKKINWPQQFFSQREKKK